MVVGKKTFVSVRFKRSRGRLVAMDYAYYREGMFVKEGLLPVERPFGPALMEWCKSFPDEILSHGCMPVVIGWGLQDRDTFDRLLEGLGDEQGKIAFVDRMILYYDVKDYARRKIRNVKPEDGWRQMVSKVARIDPAYAAMKEPSARACAEMMLALDRPEMLGVIARAFAEFLKVIMADGKITTDEAKGLRSFVNVLKREDPHFEELEKELDDVLEDDVVTDEESAQLMNTLERMKQIYEELAREDAEEKHA